MPEVNWFQMDEGLDKVITFLKTRFLQKNKLMLKSRRITLCLY